MTIFKQISQVICFILIQQLTYAQVADRYQVVIDELMADPSPQVGLPNNEWIELRNTSAIAFNLSGWRIGDASGQSGPMPPFVLQPDSFVIVCTSGAAAAMSAFGPTISITSFPSLDNTGDVIYLKSPQNRIIHSVNYTDAWYANELKKEGGWTLEMVDTNNPCTGSGNWRASTDARGGTPGKKNAVDALNKDTGAPKLVRAFATDSMNISLAFDEPLDSLKAGSVNSYSISDGVGTPQSAVVVAPVFDKVNLKLNNPLARNRIYLISVSAITDCAGNIIDIKKTIRIGLSEMADSMDIVINEILFDPKPNGTDYVELYNRSNRVIDLKQVSIANRSNAGVISNIKQVSADNYLFFPGDFMVLTENPSIIKRDFITMNPDAFAAVASMPSYNDDQGDVVILNAQGMIVDELKYDAKWHFKLINDPEGIALERIGYHTATQNPDNWHSAATSSGYGTPTYKNSQYRTGLQPLGEVTIQPEIVSPDNDGMDDFANIICSFPAPGYIANITIFDAAGRVVRYLQRNALCGIKATFRWDGIGEKGQALPAGIYIIYTAVFNLEGKKREFRNVIVLARRNN